MSLSSINGFSLLPSYSAAKNKVLAEHKHPELADANSALESAAAPSSTDAAEFVNGGNAFMQQLEKHIHDYKDGEGHLSSDMYRKLSGKMSENNDYLSQNNPAAMKMYSGLMSAGLTYDNQARMVRNVNESNKAMAKLTSGLEAANLVPSENK